LNWIPRRHRGGPDGTDVQRPALREGGEPAHRAPDRVGHPAEHPHAAGGVRELVPSRFVAVLVVSISRAA
jgi:hypothetical protein